MSTHNAVVDRPARRQLVVALPHTYDAAREHYEILVPEVDVPGFFQMASWQATLEPAEIDAPYGFMRYAEPDGDTKLAVDQPSLLSAGYDNRFKMVGLHWP
ncbi:hypothetical protein ACWGDT_23110 [Streptomyces avermitilis]